MAVAISAVQSPQSDCLPFVLHSCYYQDFFLLRTSVTIDGHAPKIRAANGIPVLQFKDVSLGLPRISNKFGPILFRFGVYHLDTFYYVNVPLFSIMFFSRNNVRKFLSSMGEVQPLLANELAEMITGNASTPVKVEVECRLFLVTLHSSADYRPKAHQVTLENFLQYIMEWEQSRLFHFESSIFDEKEMGEFKIAS